MATDLLLLGGMIPQWTGSVVWRLAGICLVTSFCFLGRMKTAGQLLLLERLTQQQPAPHVPFVWPPPGRPRSLPGCEECADDPAPPVEVGISGVVSSLAEPLSLGLGRCWTHDVWGSPGLFVEGAAEPG